MEALVDQDYHTLEPELDEKTQATNQRVQVVVDLLDLEACPHHRVSSHHQDADPGQAVAAVPTCRIYTNSNGKRCVDGGPGLKNSQTYPPGFGKSIAALVEANLGETRMHAERMHAMADSLGRIPYLDGVPTDVWEDAELSGVFRLLFGKKTMHP